MSGEASTRVARELVARAVLAPSSHNTQPWLFRSAGAGIELFADRTRALPVNDPHDRELTISCGCALMNLRVAAAARSLDARVALLPDPAEPDLLARVTLETAALLKAPVEAGLAEYIERRRTCRERFLAKPVPERVTARLVQAASAEAARLSLLAAEATRNAAADLVAKGDAIQWNNASWRRELAAWMHPRRRGDGLTVPALAAPVAQLVVRTFDMGGGVGAKDRDLAQGSPLLAILGTETDDARDWLQAGQALQRVLLTAVQEGLQASYLNQPIQVDSLRPRLRDIAGGGFPQILLRLGYPARVIAASPRRPIEDVLEPAAHP